MLDQTDCGMIAWPAMFSRFMYCGVEKVSCTVSLLGDVMLVGLVPPRLMSSDPLLCCSAYLYVKATSAAVNAVPLLHFTPWRIVKVMVLPLLLHAYAVASHGYGATDGFARSNWYSGS
jgi:hypothetical protein